MTTDLVFRAEKKLFVDVLIGVKDNLGAHAVDVTLQTRRVGLEEEEFSPEAFRELSLLILGGSVSK